MANIITKYEIGGKTYEKKQIKAAGRNGVVFANGNFYSPSKKLFTKAEMNRQKKKYHGMNRIHKPKAILFYVDIMNGKRKGWDLVKL